MYGSSTMLVYTTGHGVHGFTYEPSIGEFLLSHTDIRIPERGRIYSVNEGNYSQWTDGVKRYVDWLKVDDPRRPAAPTARATSARWSRTSTAICSTAGSSCTPAIARTRSGKLRVLYEAAPLAFIAEQAGGLASDGERRIMDMVPAEPARAHATFPRQPAGRARVRDFRAGPKPRDHRRTPFALKRAQPASDCWRSSSFMSAALRAACPAWQLLKNT